MRLQLVVLLPLVAAAACASRENLPPASNATPAVSSGPMTLAAAGIDPAWMDPSVSPCSDFFAYACGGFVKTKEIPPDHAGWGVGSEIQRSNELLLRDVLEHAAKKGAGDPVVGKIGDYYAACMDEPAIERAGLTPIRPLLDVAASVTSPATLGAAIAKLHADGVFAVFNASSGQDFQDATRVIASLDQDGLGLPDRDYYLKDDADLKEAREFYVGHIGRMLALAGVPKAEVPARVADVMRIETKLARIQQDKVERRDPYKVYHPVDLAGLTAVAKSFPWDGYFKELGLDPKARITINDPAYFTGFDALMKSEPPAAWRSYLAWRVLETTAPLLASAMVDESFALRKKLSGQSELEPRWKRCVRDVDASLGELLGQKYVAERFAGDSKARATELTREIHDAMHANLEALPWMDPPTRAAAFAKLDKMNAKVGYPDRWRAYDFTVERASYATNAVAASRFELRRQLAKIGKPVDRGEWQMSPPTVNAYYSASLNEIVIPAGELQPPYFSRDFYAPVNIGNEGANTIGHEITHGFDDEGSQFDGDGNLRLWWSAGTKAKFDEATKCVQDQYSSYEAVPGVHLNGALTSGENIADIGGVKLGYAALVAWQKAHPDQRRSVDGFDDEQLFFLAYAQGWCSKEKPEYLATLARTNPHSPPRWRVNGPMVDVPAFATAFKCTAGTPMNTGKVCAVW
jgi:predicted metalloendopeptidase